MKSVIFKTILVSAVLMALAGCASEPKEEMWDGAASISLREAWTNPAIPDGIASTECVRMSDDIASDRAEAIALARANLAKTMEIKLSDMDEIHRRKVRTHKDVSSGSLFEMTSKHVSQLTLQGSQVIKVDIVDFDKTPHVCAMVALRGKESRRIFDEIVTSSKGQIRPEDESVLWEEFKAYKAQQRLEAETQ